MGFLDSEGLRHLWGKIKGYTIPTRSLTKAQYEALTAEEKQADVAYLITDDNEGWSGGGSAEEIYITEETRIGRWIDGKPLYRQVYRSATPGTSNTPIIKISNDIVPAKIWGIAEAANFTYFPAPFIWNGSNYISLYVAVHNIYVDCASQYMGLPLTVILEYTKTTDQPEVT